MAKTKRTQTIIIKTFLLLFVFILLSMQPVFASSKLKKEDFTKMSGKYGENFISISSKYQSFFKYTNMIDETEKPAKILKTYRGVVLGDTKKTVTKKYGNAKFKKVNCSTDRFYSIILIRGYTSAASLIKKCSYYVDYIYKKAANEYRLRFYFDKKNTIKTIGYIKNYKYL